MLVCTYISIYLVCVCVRVHMSICKITPEMRNPKVSGESQDGWCVLGLQGGTMLSLSSYCSYTLIHIYTIYIAYLYIYYINKYCIYHYLFFMGCLECARQGATWQHLLRPSQDCISTVLL